MAAMTRKRRAAGKYGRFERSQPLPGWPCDSRGFGSADSGEIECNMTFDSISAAPPRVDLPGALRRLAALLPVVLLGVGCHSLPPGRLDAVNAVSNHARKGNVYLLRGWQDLYSGGIDRLAAELRATGVRGQVYQAAQWPQLAAALSRAY